MKKMLIKVVIVLSVFILTVVITSRIINTDTEDLTTNMSQATYPVVSIEYNGKEINRMYGHAYDMELSYMRDSITPLMAGRKIHFLIDTFSTIVTGVKYEVRTVNGERLIESTEITDYSVSGRKIQAEAIIKDLIDVNTEYELILHLITDDNQDIRYYTRVINPEEYHISDKLEYVNRFSSRTFDYQLAQELSTYLEPNSQADNTSFGVVNIHSKFSQITWGDMAPYKVSDSMITIKELAPMTGSFTSEYYVYTLLDGEQKYYKVKEFFRIRYGKERMYLLDYERTMDEVFTNLKASYLDNKILLGINSKPINMVESADGSFFAFVSGGRLYSYSIPENRTAFVYGFYDMYTDDVRVTNDNFDIKIMDVDEEGNVTFLVYGYMNRGDHEGECGICAYYYNAKINTIEELLYIPSDHAADLLMRETKELSYFNKDGTLYLLMGSSLYGIDSKSLEVDTVAQGLTEGSYVISDDHHLVAWQIGNSNIDCQCIELVNLETGKHYEIKVKNNETLVPIDFIGDDLIYGIANKEDITREKSGSIMIPMYEIVIENEREGPLMHYSHEDIYIVDGEVNGNQIILKRVIKKGDHIFEETLDDQIMNSEDITFGFNTLGTVVSDIYENRSVINVNGNVNADTLKHLNPKMIKNEQIKEVNLDQAQPTDEYVVYGKYGADSFHMNEAHAVKRAYEISGIVMNSDGEYIYRKTSRSQKNQIMAIKEVSSTLERSSLAVCLDVMMEYEGVVRNSQYMLSQGNTVLDILESALMDYEILDLSGCSLDMILYYVNQDIPVLVILDDSSIHGDKALHSGIAAQSVSNANDDEAGNLSINDSAVLLIGFNETEVVLLDPKKNEIYKISQEEAEAWFDESGDFFITYLKKPE